MASSLSFPCNIVSQSLNPLPRVPLCGGPCVFNDFLAGGHLDCCHFFATTKVSHPLFKPPRPELPGD